MQNRANLREQYPEFIYESYKVERSINGIHVEYVYRLGEHVFKPTVDISV